MIIAPVVIVVSGTGALWIFKDELEGILHPGVVYVEPTAERATYEQQLAAARAAVGPEYQIWMLQVFMNPKRATRLAMGGKNFQYGYVDPYRGRYLGAIRKGASPTSCSTCTERYFSAPQAGSLWSSLRAGRSCWR